MTDNLPIRRIYTNRVENKSKFKIKSGYYLELLTLETIKLLRITKNNITKDKNGENMVNLEINEVILAHCNVMFLTVAISKIQEFCIHFVYIWSIWILTVF